MTVAELNNLLDQILASSSESEWIEYKYNNSNPVEIGEYISALANAACLHEKQRAYLIFGIQDKTKKIIGTTFNHSTQKEQGQELLSWLHNQLKPGAFFTFHELEREGRRIVITEINPADGFPVSFRNENYIRIGTYKKRLKDYPAQEKELWNRLTRASFETQIAMNGVSHDIALDLIDYPAFFDLLKLPLPTDKKAILEKLAEEHVINLNGGLCDITNLGAVLFAKDMTKFDYIDRKPMRVVIYRGKNRLETIKEHVSVKGYAAGFTGLISFILDQIPTNEVMGEAIRKQTKMYPSLSIRELVGNALIHQDLSVRGSSPMVEIFSDRIEFSNPGKPLIDPLRFLDHSPISRNEKIAVLMRRMGICEERGSGFDKVVFECELYQLPAPSIDMGKDFTRITLFAYKKLKDMDQNDKVRATYLHACLKYITQEQMTNQSLRKRFNISDSVYPIASKMIADTLEAKLIKRYNEESKSRKYAKYIPFWA